MSWDHIDLGLLKANAGIADASSRNPGFDAAVRGAGLREALASERNVFSFRDMIGKKGKSERDQDQARKAEIGHGVEEPTIGFDHEVNLQVREETAQERAVRETEAGQVTQVAAAGGKVRGNVTTQDVAVAQKREQQAGGREELQQFWKDFGLGDSAPVLASKDLGDRNAVPENAAGRANAQTAQAEQPSVHEEAFGRA